MVNFVTCPLDIAWDTGRQVTKINPVSPLSVSGRLLWGPTLGSWNTIVRFMVGGFDVMTVPFAFLPDYIPPEPYPYVWEEKKEEEKPAQPEGEKAPQAQEEEAKSPPSADNAPPQGDSG